jgi:ATP-dependent RNA helicase RhlE
MVQQNEKQALLDLILSGRHQVPGEFERVLIFTRTKHGADRVVKKLSQRGIEANAIHGNKSQPQRQRALDEFRRGKTAILVATDVAARGIDIPGVSHVINYELPNVPEQYVHRIGRTARAGRDGVAIAFCAEDERAYLKDIRKTTGAELERLPLPDNFRAVVEGVGPTKPEPRGATRVSAKKIRPRPVGQSADQAKGEGAPRPKKPGAKHPARKGKPSGRPGGRPGGNSGQRSGSKPGGMRRGGKGQRGSGARSG